MLGSFIGKLDKGVCIISLVIFSLLTMTIITSDLFRVFDITGVFKQ